MVTIGLFIAANAIQRDQASDVLAKSLMMLDRAKSVVGTFTQSNPGRPGMARGEFHLKKDANLAVFSKRNSEICDGVFRTSIDRDKGTYTVRDVRVFELPYLPGFEGFTLNNGKTLVDKFKMETANSSRSVEPRNVHMMMMEGKSVVSYMVGGSTVFVDEATLMPVAAEFMGENKKQTIMKFSHVKTDVAISDDMFNFHPNDNLTEMKVVERGMLKVGQRMPISNIESMKLLEGAMAGKQNAVVLFFDDKNAPSGEMLQKLHEISKHCPKDVAVVGVARTKDWRKMFRGRLNFTVIEDADLAKDSVSALFGISKYPTLYVIDHQSEATYVQIGSNDGELNPILRGLGFSIR